MSMGRARRVSEDAFELLLRARRIPFVSERGLEDLVAIQGGKRPDFCLDVGSPRVLVEVTELTAPGPLDRIHNRVGAFDGGAITRRIRDEIADEKVQLKPYGASGHPTLVVLANPHRVGVPLGNRELLQLFGEIALSVPFDGKELRMEEGVLVHTKNRVLSDHQTKYISAVGVLEGLPRPSYFGEPAEQMTSNRLRVRIVHNPHADVPLSRTIFAAPNDVNIAYDAEQRMWIDHSTGAPVEL